MLDVLIISKSKLLFEGKAEHVILPGEQGVFQVCQFHKPIVSRLFPGRIFVGDQIFHINHGAVKVEHNTVTALVEPRDHR